MKKLMLIALLGASAILAACSKGPLTDEAIGKIAERMCSETTIGELDTAILLEKLTGLAIEFPGFDPTSQEELTRVATAMKDKCGAEKAEFWRSVAEGL